MDRAGERLTVAQRVASPRAFRRFCSKERIINLLKIENKFFVLRVKNNISALNQLNYQLIKEKEAQSLLRASLNYITEWIVITDYFSVITFLIIS
ncbi:MAG: hypothetical protein AAGF83_14590 [Cyanobacteria bacterium P01_G01_bin.67]